MSARELLRWLAPPALLAAAAACGPGQEPPGRPVQTAVPFSEGQLRRIMQMSPLPPLPTDTTNRYADDPLAARFGQALFFDERLSADGAVSCATCHDPDRGFTDGKQLALGQEVGNRHTPTLWNVAHHRWLTWDGRADSLWMQALDPIEDPREMGTTRGKLARVIADDPGLLAAYSAVFGPIKSAALRDRPDDVRPP
ncbi:MAG: cytochrome-c peroxidase, partial [Planctomycetota bacterium]|nr:cytochrome-c peroxidase [Planctomycetota bacterium]